MSARLKNAMVELVSISEAHIAGIVVRASQSKLEKIKQAISLLPGSEIHAVSPEGKMVVTLEASRSTVIADQLNAIHALPGVYSALWTQPVVPAEPFHDAMRGTTPIDEEAKPPLIAPIENKDVIRGRAYTQQPPTIPRKIDGYQLDKNANRCLACHARSRAAESGAVPVGVSHYLTRDNEALGSLSPRRYFCTQCHVPQVDTKPLVGNTFKDAEDVRVAPGPAGPNPARKK